jgi:membrane-associated protease RseP (regulator of RpoE activity)
MDGAIVAIALVAAYVLFIFWLVQSGRLQKWNLSLMLGVVLMVRTQRGKGVIDFLARPRRLWNAFADLGTVVTLTGMVGMTAVFAWSVWFSLQPGSGIKPLGANEILVIPGVNPFVPLWYGLIALVVTLIVHEGGHGVLARANGMRVKSLGLLVAVVPIGAFVEPDDEDLKLAPRRRRLRVFAAGPAVNLAFAVAALVGFSALVGSIAPTSGVHVAGVVPGAPAERAGLAAGSTVVAADGHSTPDWASLRAFLNTTHPGQAVALTLDDGLTHAATLQSRWDTLTPAQREEATAKDPQGAESLQHQSFLGVSPFLPENARYLAHPFTSGAIGFLSLVSLPIGEVRQQPMLSLYLPAFHHAPFAPALFWPLVNVLFWVFWINLMVGLTNILPMLPLDGGHIFRDGVGGLVHRLRPAMPLQKLERLVGWAATSMSLLILGAFILQIVGPRLVS